jgi:DNA processing protein
MADLEKQLHLLALCAIDGVSWSAVARAGLEPDGLERLLNGDQTERSTQGTATAAAIRAARSELPAHIARARDEVHLAKERVGAKLVTVLDDDYPSNLRLIFNLPPFLFYRGHLQRDDARSVAVVGTRQASKEGLRRAAKMAAVLIGEGVTVLSGLAVGIDTAAHTEALKLGGRTIAVMGAGSLRTYPRENRALAEEIVKQGAIVSQFWPNQPPASHTFPRRNVVTSGMSQGTVVIEANSTSGAKMQARLALQHGKYAFLVESLVTQQDWARKFINDYPRAIQISDVNEVLSRMRSAESVNAVVDGRRDMPLEDQLTLDFA